MSLILVMLGLLAAPAATAQAPASDAQAPAPAFVDVVQVSGLVDPVVVDFLLGAVDDAEDGGAEVLVVQLDSPGSIVAEDRLDELITRLGSADVPVAVWVGDAGAQALGGAGRLAANAPLLGMAPGASLGAIGGDRELTCVIADGCRAVPDDLRSRIYDAELAFDEGITDFNPEESAILGTFIAALDGDEAGGRTLATATFVEQGSGPPVATLDVQARLAKLPLLSQLLHTAASPSVAYLLLTIGLALLVFELFTAGVGIAGLVGAGALVLASYGLTVLPVDLVGLALLLLGTFGFAVDVQTGAPRVWTAIGVVAYVVGSVLLFDDPVGIGLLPLAAGVVAMVLMMLAGLPATIRSRFSTPTIGRSSMVGELGEAKVDVTPEGVVSVRDALWPAFANRSTPIAAGDVVRVVGIDGTRLEVEPEAGGARDHRERRPAG